MLSADLKADFSSALASSTNFPKNKNHSYVEKIVVDVF